MEVSIMQKSKSAAISKLRRIIANTQNYGGVGVKKHTTFKDVVTISISNDEGNYYINMYSNYFSENTIRKLYSQNFKH